MSSELSGKIHTAINIAQNHSEVLKEHQNPFQDITELGYSRICYKNKLSIRIRILVVEIMGELQKRWNPNSLNDVLGPVLILTLETVCCPLWSPSSTWLHTRKQNQDKDCLLPFLTSCQNIHDWASCLSTSTNHFSIWLLTLAFAIIILFLPLEYESNSLVSLASLLTFSGS